MDGRQDWSHHRNCYTHSNHYGRESLPMTRHVKGGQLGSWNRSLPRDNYSDYQNHQRPRPDHYRSQNPENMDYPNTQYHGPPRNMADETNVRKRKTVRDLWNKHAERSSIVGLPYIQGSKNRWVKLIWVILLFAAMGAMGWHLWKLVHTYLDYEKSTSISFGFSQLPFPVITFCNINPMRYPLRTRGSAELQAVIEAADPFTLSKMLDNWTPSTASDDYTDSSFFDDTNFGIDTTNIDFTGETFEGSWQSESTKSTFDSLQEEFVLLFNQENATTRMAIGHQIRNMLLQCSFAGRKCFQRNFTLVENGRFGNCYSISYEKFISRRSGSEEGLEMILDLETDEYLPGLTLGKGLQLVIHPANTLAFPDKEGIAINAGMETTIAIQQVSIDRIGDPYLPDCRDLEGEFKQKYGIRYTRTQCQEFCEVQRINDQCKCVDERRIQVNHVMGKTDLKPCRTMEEYQCIAMTEYLFAEDNSDCNCDSPCQETQYKTTISARQWPGEPFANLIRDVICKDRGEMKCSALKNMSSYDIQQEFVRLKIYYKDLNYESLEESADYQNFQFYSDIGGVIGLWIGLSLLSVFELVHLLFDILIFVCCKCGNGKDESGGNGGNINPGFNDFGKAPKRT